MKIRKTFFALLVLSVFESCYGQQETYLNHKILTTPLVCQSESRRIILDNDRIDSIVIHSSMKLNTESSFTFVYLRSGKQIEKNGECIYHSTGLETVFCILNPPCCDGNTSEYLWLKYDLGQDTIEQMSRVLIYTTTDIYSENIFWNAQPKKIKILDFQLRTTPQVNDIEEDYDLRQIGNVIYESGLEQVSVYELGYSKEQPSWRICAIQDAKNNYLIGWCRTTHLSVDTN